MARLSFRDRFFTPAGGAGDDVAARHRAVRRRRGGERSWSGCRSSRRPASARWRGAGGCSPRCRGPPPSARVAAEHAERAVAGYAMQAEDVQEALRPGGGVGGRRAAAGALAAAVAAGSTRASTSRGGSPGAATRSSAPSARSTPRRRRPSWPSCERSIGRTHAVAVAGRRRRRRSRPSWRRPTGLSALADRSRDRLRLLDARFDELVARTVEVSVGSGDTDVLGDDVDGLVTELESAAHRDGGDRPGGQRTMARCPSPSRRTASSVTGSDR